MLPAASGGPGGGGGAVEIPVFTTRVDTLMGATYVVIAPEHPLAASLVASGAAPAELTEYVAAASRRSDLDRTAGKLAGKSGVPTGLEVAHPLTGERIPLWVADYVLAGYGTGAVMAVPAHDERDFAFAAAHGLPVRQVVAPSGAAGRAVGAGVMTEPMTEPGVAVNSGAGLDGLPTAEATAATVARLAAAGKGQAKVSYKLRDWVFSRQARACLSEGSPPCPAR